MSVDLSIIDKLIPLSTLSVKNKSEVAKSAQIRKAQSGSLLFSKGDKNTFYLYLKSGSIELLDGSRVASTLESIGEIIPHPIDNTSPRQFTAICKRNSEILKLESSFVDLMTTWEKTGTFEVEELNFEAEKTKTISIELDSDDWMTSLLQLRIFKEIPPDSLHNIFIKFEKVDCKAGEKIITQGEESDSYYIILKGKCLVMRSTQKNQNGVKLGILHPGDSFGGDGLIANSTRNSSVIMLSHGTVLKLPKDIFLTAMVAPLTPSLSIEQVRELKNQGTLDIYDIRNPDEYAAHHIIDSVNIPLILLRLKLPSKPHNKQIVCCCENQLQSRAACYILREKGYEGFILEGGFKSVPPDLIAIK